MSTPVIIVGAGPGGLTLALALHQRNIPVHVYEAVPQLKPLGVGINVLPHSVRVLHALDLAPALAEIAIPTAALHYYNKHGQLIWAEPRGLAAGYAYPQYSVHRGQLQHLLYTAARIRLGDDCLHLDRTLEHWEEQKRDIRVHFRSRTGTRYEVTSTCLVAADGIHSAARRRLWPDEGPPLFAGRILWRGVSEAAPFLGGRTMIMAGHQHQKFVCYPISPAHEQRGSALLNWVAELTIPGRAAPQDWNRQVPKERFAEAFARWRFDWLNTPTLIDQATAIYEYPLTDRDPLPQWSHGHMTLLGDAAHPMYPIGSNGASQAILDAECLADQLATNRDVVQALETYDAIRRPATTQIVLLNRANGPEQVMQIAEDRAPNGFSNVQEVIAQAELEAIAARYKQAAGFTTAQVNQRYSNPM